MFYRCTCFTGAPVNYQNNAFQRCITRFAFSACFTDVQPYSQVHDQFHKYVTYQNTRFTGAQLVLHIHDKFHICIFSFTLAIPISNIPLVGRIPSISGKKHALSMSHAHATFHRFSTCFTGAQQISFLHNPIN